jgi:butyrate kinase
VVKIYCIRQLQMSHSLTGVYFTLFIVAGMIAYAGTDETLKVFEYVNLQIKYLWVMIRMAIMRYQLKKDLDQMLKTYKKDLDKINDERKQELF